jgi:hypothetical protein
MRDYVLETNLFEINYSLRLLKMNDDVKIKVENATM